MKARALHPDDPESRARALDGLLREQLDRLENAELAPAARLLFGAETTTSGATLTARREAAAKSSGYEVHHFRKRIEPKVVELVAWQLLRDSETFSTRHASAPELHAATGPLALPADVFAWEAAEHQHTLAGLWGAVYLLRAELLTVARMVSMTADDDALSAAADAALWRHALVLVAVARYRSAYGAVMLHAATELGPDEIAAYAGWTPALTPGEELLLAEVADPTQGLTHFMTRLTETERGAATVHAWRRSLTGRPHRQGGGPEEEVTS
ncbi:hypothetical protein [Thermomonospora umbrina]|uniref:hypothetical protein n=1 Tax=Thermomonospora umbrina TaxID=111806 RepID=UPI000E22213C|nr:hypothetical protein [Thermomonospora umbrina]